MTDDSFNISTFIELLILFVLMFYRRKLMLAWCYLQPKLHNIATNLTKNKRRFNEGKKIRKFAFPDRPLNSTFGSADSQGR